MAIVSSCPSCLIPIKELAVTPEQKVGWTARAVRGHRV